MAEQYTIEHDSRNVAYRFPTGATVAGSRVWLGIRIAGAQSASGQIRLWRDNAGELLVDLTPSSETPAPSGDIWLSATVKMPPEGGLIWYYFILSVDGKTVYYGNNDGRLGGRGQAKEEAPASYQITVYDKGADTPAWFRRSVMYQIFPDRFYREGPAAEKPGAVLHSCWKDAPQYFKDEYSRAILAYDFFGGNLAGIRAKLRYLKDLGISVIYFNPVFEAESNHRYDTGDYHKIDPMLGTEEEFSALCRDAKEMGIRILIDGVFSHTGSNSRYFNRYGQYDSIGAYQSKKSPYFAWYDFVNYPESYNSWWGFDTLPNINETEPSYMDFIISAEDSVLHHWSKAGISGWRLDVIDELPPEFSQAFYRELKKTDPEAVLIGEIWEDASNKISYSQQRAYLSGLEIDGAMNYPFRTAVLDFLLGHMDGAALGQHMESLRENYPAHNFYAMMNLLGSHDVERLMTILGEAPPPDALDQKQRGQYRLPKDQAKLARARAGLAMLWQLTFPGVPSIYYGDEIGMQGYRDPYNRGPYDWEDGDKELRARVRRLIYWRNHHPALSTGEFLPLYSEGNVYAYARLIRGGRDMFQAEAPDETFVVVLNRSRRDIARVRLGVGDFACGTFHLLMSAGNSTETIPSSLVTKDGGIEAVLPPLSGALYQLQKPEAAKPRQAGLLLHPASLPSSYGIGDIGPAAYQFVDFLAAAGHTVWQILPLCPVGDDASPYASSSAFAGNPLLISLEWLADAGWLTEDELAAPPPSSVSTFKQARAYKEELLHKAWDRFRLEPPKEYESFCRQEAEWLDGYALFMATHEKEKGKPWYEWEASLRDAVPEALEDQRRRLRLNIEYVKFKQYLFFRQWDGLHRYAQAKGVDILGDMPLFLSLDSADVWLNQKLFQIAPGGKPKKVAGVPPDYFSPTGQLWGNPQYDWDAMKRDSYAWWIARFKRLFSLVDVVRVDHFRGLESYWEVDGDAKTAENGRWVKGPGKDLFDAVEKALGKLPIVAEDLGVQTPEVAALREACGFPGMKVLQFELTGNGTPRIGCALPEDSIAYTGTHDNNTVAGWYQDDLREEDRRRVAAWLGLGRTASGVEAAVRMVETAYASAARLVITPMQDILGLDGTHRMNTPGTVSDTNWNWRMQAGVLTTFLIKRLKQLAEKHHRLGTGSK
ncbi:MAG: 4-alpha-glucanotransferase [Schwartzia sp.]|nr:4-alpha-glucanotransferase [Schwartzia sp. (in: firmicutes)]